MAYEDTVYARETTRLEFIERRDGIAAAFTFAQQGIQVYRARLNQRNGFGRKTGYGRAYQRELVESILVYRCYLRNAS